MKEIFLHHKGVSAIARYSEEDGAYHGKLEGIPDLATFGGSTPEEAEKDFRDLVEGILEDELLLEAEKIAKDSSIKALPVEDALRALKE